MSITKAEMTHIAKFLDELTDRFGTDGCNDMSVENTPENAQMLRCMIRCSEMEPEDVKSDLEHLEAQVKSRKEIIINNTDLCYYLLGIVKKEAGIKDD